MSATALPYNPRLYAWVRISFLFLAMLGLLTFVVMANATITCPKENTLLAGDNGVLIVTEKHEGIIVGAERKCQLRTGFSQMPLPLLSQLVMFVDRIHDRLDWYKSELLKKLISPNVIFSER